tara:strand:- start:2041 stop:2442 length:402 start_codon:yes stop_codon:yes gene_type:complete
MILKRLNVKNNIIRQLFSPSLSLFTSFSTLICCALPALLISIGMGASLASFVSAFPWIIFISKYKIQTFTLAAVLLIVSVYLFWQGRNAPCPSDPIQAKICSKLRFINLIMLFISLVTYLAGFFFAFVVVNFL